MSELAVAFSVSEIVPELLHVPELYIVPEGIAEKSVAAEALVGSLFPSARILLVTPLNEGLLLLVRLNVALLTTAPEGIPESGNLI